MTTGQPANARRVKAPSGSHFIVLTTDEEKYFTDTAQKYLKDNHFTNVSDMQDLDRLLMMELMVWRWGQWLSNEQDYDGVAIDPTEIQKSVKEYSTEIRQIKKLLGIDKVTRDKEKGESVADYIENLRRRAKEFGVMRSKQATQAITLFMELQALVQLHDNCDAQERVEQNIEITDILDWLRSVAFPEFNAIDEEFRKNPDGQAYWVRDM